MAQYCFLRKAVFHKLREYSGVYDTLSAEASAVEQRLIGVICRAGINIGSSGSRTHN